MAQHLVVIGNPMRCGQPDCGEPATVLLRQFHSPDSDGNEILYCDTCWLATRRGYAPLVAQDATDAMRDLEDALAGGDGNESGVASC